MKIVDTFEEYSGDQAKKEVLDGRWEIEEIISVSDEEPEDLEEGIIIGADFGNAEVIRGKKIYITARISKKDDNLYNRSQIGVIETRVVNIFRSLDVLNRIKKQK